MLLTVIVFVFTLLILILSHEFGHFIIAKKFGIKVLEFGFGIPPKIWGKKIGETIYSLNWIPVGGFVRLLGEDEPDPLEIKRSIQGPERSRYFSAKPVWQRIVVVGAGVVMNLILAWVMFYIVLGVQNFQVLYPTLEPVVFINDIEKGSPADLAGLKSGEKLLEIDGQKIGSIDQASSYIKARPDQAIKIKVVSLDTAGEQTLEVTPKKFSDGTTRIGVVFSPFAVKKYTTFTEKLFSGITYTFDLIRLTYQGLGQVGGFVFHNQLGQASQYVSGPVGAAVATNSIVSLGKNALIPYLWFLGVFSLSLAAINILPFPALDGGRLLFLLIEAIFRVKVKAEIERYVHTIGMAVLLALILLITFSDLSKIIPH